MPACDTVVSSQFPIRCARAVLNEPLLTVTAVARTYLEVLASLRLQVWRELAVVGNAIRSAREWHRNRFNVQEGGACAHSRERGRDPFKSAPTAIPGKSVKRNMVNDSSTPEEPPRSWHVYRGCLLALVDC